jgi:hypothetical protein
MLQGRFLPHQRGRGGGRWGEGGGRKEGANIQQAYQIPSTTIEEVLHRSNPIFNKQF